jgi:hypothetical protein
MGKYKIKIDYLTGNSFGSEDASDIIELDWDNLEIAKENLQYINEHYKQYEECNSYSFRKSKSKDEIYESNKDKDWFVGEIKYRTIADKCCISNEYYENNKELCEPFYDDFYAENCIKLKADNGNFMQMSCFWCGYFETLHSAEIIIDNNDMKISFR